jgi:hypothetical protein
VIVFVILLPAGEKLSGGQSRSTAQQKGRHFLNRRYQVFYVLFLFVIIHDVVDLFREGPVPPGCPAWRLSPSTTHPRVILLFRLKRS